jgi:multisubunit Na+/H+ antiporter MnhB subunit
MALWAIIVFVVGVIIMLFHIFQAPAAFSYLWAIILMIIAFVMLYRIAQKEKEAEKEKLVERIQDLEAQLQKQEKK